MHLYFCIHSVIGDYPPYRDLKDLCALAGRLVNKCICPQAPPGSLSSLALLATSSRSLPFRAVADMFASWTLHVLYVFCSAYVSLAYSICSFVGRTLTILISMLPSWLNSELPREVVLE